MQDLLTVQQFADAAGITKQAVYKALNNKLKPYVQLVDGKKMLYNKALQEIYGVEVNQPVNQPLHNQNQPMDVLIAMLQRELDAKNELIASQQRQLEAKDRQIENLTASLDHITLGLDAAQVLHAVTMQQQQLQAPDVQQIIEEDTTTGQEKKKGGFFSRWKKQK